MLEAACRRALLQASIRPWFVHEMLNHPALLRNSSKDHDRCSVGLSLPGPSLLVDDDVGESNHCSNLPAAKQDLVLVLVLVLGVHECHDVGGWGRPLNLVSCWSNGFAGADVYIDPVRTPEGTAVAALLGPCGAKASPTHAFN